MVKKIFLMFFFKMLVLNAQQLEDRIYNALDTFLESKTAQSLKILNLREKEFQKKVNTKSEHLALVILQCNKAFFLLKKNQTQHALVTYEAAWERYSEKQLLNYNITEYCLKPLGNLYTKTKDYANAEYVIKYYISLAEKEKNKAQKIAGIINLSKVYQSVNNHIATVEMIDAVLAESDISKVQKEKLSNIKTNSLLALRLNPDENFKKEDLNYVSYKQNLFKGNYSVAAAYFRDFKNDVLSTLRDKRSKAKLFLEEAQINLLLKAKTKANVSLDSVVRCFFPDHPKVNTLTKDHLYAESLLVDVFDMKAMLEVETEKALKYYDKSFYIEELLTQQITSQETNIIFQANERKRSEACILLLLEKYENTKKASLLERALFYADIGKATVLKNRIFKRKLWREFPNDSIVQLEKRLLQQQETLINEVVKEQKTTNNFVTISDLNKELSVIGIKIKQTQAIIRNKCPENVKENNLLSTIRNKIADANTVVVSYFFGKKYIYQFIVDESSVKVNTIEKNDETEKEIIGYIQLFNSSVSINNNVINYTQKAFDIYQLLKFDKTIPYKNVVVIPDGILSFIPFETLLTQKTTTTFFSNMPFVAKQQKIVYGFSLTTFLNATSSFKKEPILGMFPVFKNTSKELKYSLEEAHVVENNFSSVVFKNEKATKNNFINNLDKASIIHLSTHSGNKGFIASSYISFYDGELTLNELYTKETNSNLVVLSACETGVGTVFKGASPLSVARGFNYIGVDNLLFSLWKINDKSTAKLMEYFYKSYKKTNSISTANHQSKLNYLKDETIQNSKKSPYYWSAFVYYGTPDFVERNNKIRYVFLTIALLGLLLIIKKLRKN